VFAVPFSHFLFELPELRVERIKVEIVTALGMIRYEQGF
jgi:hypothetical protein